MKYYAQGIGLLLGAFACVAIIAFLIGLNESENSGPSFQEKCQDKGGITVTYSHGKSSDSLCFREKDAIPIK